MKVTHDDRELKHFFPRNTSRLHTPVISLYDVSYNSNMFQQLNTCSKTTAIEPQGENVKLALG